MNANLSGYIALAIWSLSALLVVNTHGIPPLFTAVIFCLSGAFSIALAYINKPAQLRMAFTQSKRVYLITIGGISTYTIAYMAALKLSPAFEGNMLNYLWPLFLSAFAAIAAKQRLHPKQILALTLGFAGTVLLLTAQNDASNMDYPLRMIGWICGIVAALSWALYSTLTRNTPFPVTTWIPILLTNALIAYGLHLWLEPAVIPTSMQWVNLIILGASCLAYAFWDIGMKGGNVQLLATLAYGIPILSQLSLVIFGHASLNPATAIACILVLSGCLIAATFKNKTT